ncbi:MAG TPA: PxKF domain-containing protein [Actinomycetes bacterium]
MQVAAAGRRRVLAPSLAAVAVLALLVALPGNARAAGAQVAISQVYGGGGNSGAPFANDFIELINRGTSSTSLAGWSLQYASATGTGNIGANAGQLTELPAVSLAPGQYLLVQEASNAAVGAALPPPDVTDDTPINMAAGGGKVALVNSTTPLGCNGGSTPCPAAALESIVDLVGYDGANFFEGGGAAPAGSNTTAVLRNAGGCTDTDDNAADFSAGAPQPRNTAGAPNPCPANQPVAASCGGPLSAIQGTAASARVSATDPDGRVVSIALDSVTPSPAPGSITLGGLTPATAPGGQATATVTVDAATPVGSYAVRLAAANDDPTPQVASCTLTVNVTVPTAIHDIQGAGHISPRNGRTVAGVTGVVTARSSNGFWFQDPSPDADPATSEGLFVFTSSAPAAAVGDAVVVAGRVAEFRPGGASSTNLTTTEITGPAVTVQSSGNPLPAPTVVGTGGRLPPGEVIEDDATGDVETSGTFDPASDGIDFWESLEGMRLQLNDPVATGPTNAFGETSVVGDDGANASVRTARGGVVVRRGDFNPERVFLDDLLAPIPSVDVGDRFAGAVVGVLDYNFGNFMLEVTDSPTVVPGGLQREIAAPTGANQLAVATFNVENLDPGDPQSKFDQLAGLIVNNLRAPDVVAVEEIQDDNGPTDDGTVTAGTTFAKLIAAVRAAGGPTYDFRSIDPVNDQDGGEPGGNIRVGFLFRSDRGLAFVDRPGGTSTAATTVVGAGADTRLSFSPGRIDPTNPAFSSSRKPLAGEFTYNGHHLFVIANHFNSKGGDDPLFGHRQPPSQVTEAQRTQQATVVHDFVASLEAADPDAEVVVLGDLNDFEFSNALGTLQAGGVLQDLIATLPQEERYTYDFEGNSQALDHILLSDSLFARPFAYDAVHVNAEFASQASDHDPQVVRLTLPPLLGFSGFLPPVDNLPVRNLMRAGWGVPVSFRLDGGFRGLGIMAAGFPTSRPIACDTGAPSDQVETTVPVVPFSVLLYDVGSRAYVYLWKTDRAWADTCRQLIVKLTDGSVHRANFQFTR